MHLVPPLPLPIMRDDKATVLVAFAPDIRDVSNILRGICLNTSNQRALMTVNDTGLQVNVQEAHTILATAWIGKELFEEFTYNPEGSEDEDEEDERAPAVSFSFQLHTLLDCLNIFGSGTGPASQKSRKANWRYATDSDNEDQSRDNARSRGRDAGSGRIDSFFPRADGKGTAMRLSYAGYGSRLSLMLAESSCSDRAENSKGSTTTTKCELATYEADDWVNIEVDSQHMVLKCILKSSWLRDALSDIDPTCEKITIIGRPHIVPSSRQHDEAQSLLRVHAAGPFGSTEMDFPEAKEVLETFECESNVSFSYRFSLIAKSMKALQNSNKASIRIDREGILSLQFLTTTRNPKGAPVNTIVEFNCLSIDESV